jgi:hypothetical protein
MSSPDMTAMEAGRKAGDGEVRTYQGRRARKNRPVPEIASVPTAASKGGKQGNEFEIRNPARGESDA